MRKPDGQTIFLLVAAGAVLVAVSGFLLVQGNGRAGNGAPTRRSVRLESIPFNGRRAFQYLEDICKIGRRVSGSEGMRRQQAMLRKHFEQLGGRVRLQQFDVRHPQDGSRVTMGNMIVQWHPDRKERVLLCAHYDTRPFPDEDPDPRKRKDLFLGANDGGSGTAVLCEMAHYMPDLKGKYGVDFVLFDGEELVFDSQRDPFFLGSTHFAQDYRRNPPAHRYKFGILLDMVGDRELQIYREQNSRRFAPRLLNDVWNVAADLGVEEFIPRTRHTVNDDHLPLNRIAKIPTIDIIDFDYPRPGLRRSYWHTTADTPDKCSALSLAKVGWVVLEWLKRLK